ncbi:MAG TPA: hypothetical protein IAA84_12305 [Candidatus Alectryocaccomicrobium excrementavium]|uniref:Uncharacterized protein n=1 Tax=Candidatus Alectryocaccomicrobium excrementavium TaxID=2840668 RepID=A0A9D1G2E2_9FIRM|nr:hypothetical protein [Candidatus Alectryocaccomicrobium excrementavium]
MGAFSAETEAFLRQAMERHSAMVYRLAYARTRRTCIRRRFCGWRCASGNLQMTSM